MRHDRIICHGAVACFVRNRRSQSSNKTGEYPLVMNFTVISDFVKVNLNNGQNSCRATPWDLLIQVNGAMVINQLTCMRFAEVLHAATAAGIKRIAQAITNKVDSQNGEQDQGAGEKPQPGSGLQVAIGSIQHISPGGGCTLHTQPQKTDICLGNNCRGNPKCRTDDQRRQCVRQ